MKSFRNIRQLFLLSLSLFFIGVILILTSQQKSVNAQTTTDSFTFTAVGDYGNDKGTSSAFTKVLEGIGHEQPAFHLALGDLLYTNTIDYNTALVPWCDHVKKSLNRGAGKAENDSWGLNFPFEIIAGNHDTGESNANIITNATPILNCLPHRINNITESNTAKSALKIASSYGVEYYFDYPSTSNPIARIILIAPDLYGFTYAKGTQNYDFVKNAIIDGRTKGIPWIILGQHKNCITNGIKSCNEYSPDLMNMMAGQDLGPNGTIGQPVDVVLQGHEHSYHRSKQLKVNTTTCTKIQVGGYDADCVTNPGPTYFKKGEGKIIDIVGTGGVSIRSISGASDSEAGYFASWMGSNVSYPVAGQENTWGFTKFTVTRTSLTGKFIATSGKNFTDSFVISSDATVTSTPTGTKKPGDADSNGSVNVLDYQILSNNFGKTGSTADFNGDNTVNVLDYQILSNNFGK